MNGEKVHYIDEYESSSWFGIWEANSEHFVFKSKVSSHTFDNQLELIPTVDIVFVGIMYFEFIPDFHCIKLEKASDNSSISLAKKYDKGYKFLESDERVYKIHTKNYLEEEYSKSLYLVTAGIWIYEHNCQNYESIVSKTDYLNKVSKTLKLN